MSANRYAVLITEKNHPGYLLIGALGSGAFGAALAVLSLADNQIYVRKFEHVAEPWVDQSIQSLEVRNHLSHPNIPKLICYEEHMHEAKNRRWQVVCDVKTASTWQFCNGGTLHSMLKGLFVIWDKHEEGLKDWRFEDRMVDHNLPSLYTIPEAFVWQFFATMLSTIIHMHEKGVAHTDLHAANIFLHWPASSSSFPEVFIGDFGVSTAYPARHIPTKMVGEPWLVGTIRHVRALLDELPSRALKRPQNQGSSAAAAPRRKQIDQLCNDIWQWYFDCLLDHHCLADLLENLILSSPDFAGEEHEAIENAARYREGVNEYSPRLTKWVAEYIRIVAEATSDGIRPKLFMEKVKWLLGVVRSAPEDATREATTTTTTTATGSDPDRQPPTPPEPTILQALRPPIPTATPALWSTYGAVGARDGDTLHITKDHRWHTQLDFGTFRIVPVEKAREDGDGVAKWSVLGGQVHDDDDDDTDGCTSQSQSQSESAPPGPSAARGRRRRARPRRRPRKSQRQGAE